MRSLKDHERTRHLCWGAGEVEQHLGEDTTGPWGKPAEIHSHLKDLPTADSGVLSTHHMSPEETEHHKKHDGTLSGTENQHKLSYKSSSSGYNVPLRQADRIGGRLKLSIPRTGTPPQTAYKSKADSIETMDNVTSNPSSHDQHAFRGIHPSAGIHKLKPGDTFTDHGFTGASHSSFIARSFAGTYHHADHTVPDDLKGRAIMAKIHIPAGTKGHYLDIDSDTPHHEKEFLLHRGARFRIDKHEKVDNPSREERDDDVPGSTGTHLIHMTVIGQHPKEIHYPEVKATTSPGVADHKMKRTFSEHKEPKS